MRRVALLAIFLECGAWIAYAVKEYKQFNDLENDNEQPESRKRSQTREAAQ
jgi:hypothetical protein